MTVCISFAASLSVVSQFQIPEERDSNLPDQMPTLVQINWPSSLHEVVSLGPAVPTWI